MTATRFYSALGALRRFTAPPRTDERCDLCGARVAEEHEHLLDPSSRGLSCACVACATLFSGDGATHRRRVVSRAVPLDDVRLDEGDFRDLGVPVRFAFLYPSQIHDCVFATYPNTAGATESVLASETWAALVRAHPSLAVIEADLEGLLVCPSGGAVKAYRASIDVCHRMIGAARGRRPGDVEWVEREFAKLSEGRHG